jgi:hypothetical protein
MGNLALRRRSVGPARDAGAADRRGWPDVELRPHLGVGRHGEASRRDRVASGELRQALLERDRGRRSSGRKAEAAVQAARPRLLREGDRLVRVYFHTMGTGGCGQLNNFCLLSFPGGWSCSIFSAGESQQAGGAMAGCARTGAKIRLFKARRTRSARTNASFRSPSRNISCEMTDDPRGSSPHVYCQSFAKPHSVLMDVTGRLKICRGRLCLGDPGEHTPVLRYGKRVQVGRFTCRSRRSGVSCAVTKTGMGFLIDRDRVERLRP